ncbi:MAG TPA: glycosyltransferase [Dongiaceae bacterium]|nr:glycosyltransferase [Dongiaceae bacterium]
MKILWVKADRLLPVQNGGNIRSYHIARHLAQGHQLTFFSYYDGHRDPAYETALRAEFSNAVALCTGKPELSSWRRVVDYATHLADSTPYAIGRFRTPVVRDQLVGWFNRKAFDVVVCDFLDAAVNFPQELTIPTVLFQHNVESEIWRRHAENGSGWAKKAGYRLEFSKMQSYERSMVRHFDHVIAVSENDRKLMSQWVDPSRISVVPTGVDLKQFRPDPDHTAREPVVMFVGAMDWMPNVDGVEYFCREIWPRVLHDVPSARFRIVGRNPVPRVHGLASDTIEVTGRVASVVEHLREAAVVVVPLRVGGGTRLKIYEAMAMGRTVVATTIGAEGLDVRDGDDIMLADDPQKFAEAVVMLLNNVALRRRYERAAAASAARFDWPAVGAKFGEVLERQLSFAASEQRSMEIA